MLAEEKGKERVENPSVDDDAVETDNADKVDAEKAGTVLKGKKVSRNIKSIQ
jgi:hypothetical protein